MTREDQMVTVTLRLTRHMTDEDLAELAGGLPEWLPRLVREAETSGGNVTLTLIRPRPDVPVSSPADGDPQQAARTRAAVERARIGGNLDHGPTSDDQPQGRPGGG